MKRFLVAVSAAVLSLAAFTSCQEDAPSINYQNSTTINVSNDYSEVVKELQDLISQLNSDNKSTADLLEAIADMLESIGDKVAALEAAMTSNLLSLTEKIDVLTAALNSGFVS